MPVKYTQTPRSARIGNTSRSSPEIPPRMARMVQGTAMNSHMAGWTNLKYTVIADDRRPVRGGPGFSKDCMLESRLAVFENRREEAVGAMRRRLRAEVRIAEEG